MARLLADENFPFPGVVVLRDLGHDVRTLQDIGYAGLRTPDDAVLRLATEDARAVLTINRRHFIRLHDQMPNHGGIIVCSFDPDFDSLARRIHYSVKATGSLSSRLIRVNRPSA